MLQQYLGNIISMCEAGIYFKLIIFLSRQMIILELDLFIHGTDETELSQVGECYAI